MSPGTRDFLSAEGWGKMQRGSGEMQKGVTAICCDAFFA